MPGSLRTNTACLLIMAVPSLAQVVSSDFNSIPTEEGWTFIQDFCDPITSIDEGKYVQILSMDACPGEAQGGEDVYRRTIDQFIDVERYFLEFKASATGPREEIQFGAPIVLANANSFGINYHVTISDDQIRLLRDVAQPILFFDVSPNKMHTIRHELDNNTPATYKWFIDGQLVDEGLAEGAFPVQNPRITWQGRSRNFPTVNLWDYIRYGALPQESSGDWDSDLQIDDNDAPFFAECMLGPGIDAGPGCRWADFDADTDVDCADRDAFLAAWTGANDPPPLPNCTGLAPIPAVSHWGAAVTSLLIMICGSLVFRHRLSVVPHR